VTGCAAVLALSGAPAQAQSSCTADRPRINVIVEGVRSDRGDLVVELYANDEAGFLKQKGRVQRVRVSASAPVTNACLGAPAAGAYAVVLYHDENSDQKFNRTIIGMPSEGFGLSNNVRPRLSAPSLESVLIQAPEGEITIRVQMRYMVGRRG
jgi:uncharacterized protein (DUF2141 family)